MKKVIYEERTYREVPEPSVIKQADDAWHPLKNPYYVEWWYFDVMTADGGIIRGQFQVSGNISHSRGVRTAVRVSYVKPDGTELAIEEKFPYSAFKASTEVCDVKIGQNFIKGDLAHCKLHIEDSEKSLDLELDSEINGITSYSCFGSEDRYMYWVVPQPRGRAKGIFRTKEGSFNIEGVGYRDHNWLNFSPENVIAYWDWGRIYDKEFTIIFADIVMTKKFANAEIKPLLIYDPRKLIYLTNESRKWSLAKEGIKFDPKMQVKCAEVLLLQAQDEDLSLEVNLKLDKVFQKIDLLADFNPVVRWFIRTFKARPTATSFYSVGSGRLSISGRERALACTAIHELVGNT